MFAEDWRRYVLKLGTGVGKTKVLSLLIAWGFFHKTYEHDSTLARNFLLIAPNIIVLDRLRNDFDGLKIFNADPVIPDNGYAGQNWQDDFQLSLHIQDEVRVTQKTGNLFLTNIHRVNSTNTRVASFDDDDTADYFLGERPVVKTTDSKIGLEDIVRNIDELIVLNDEAHHIHDESLAWFKSIQDIHYHLKQKGKELSLQLDVTATPRHNNGAIFVQSVCDFPLVEAIHQNIVKHPVIPDEASQGKLEERESSKFTERHRDFLHLGFKEWEKSFDEHRKLGKKAILFVMTDDTKNCDEVKEYLEETYSELKGKVLVIHTKRNGEISETVSSGKNKEELKELREWANTIDSGDSKYRAIVSVLMLKEGWDVRNVTTIVGLRAYNANSNILPEQTLGRGLRKMYPGFEVPEYVSVIGTPAFMNFVSGINMEGVELERRAMGEGRPPIAPIVIEVDQENPKKDIEKLDIQIPVLSPRMGREFKNLSDLNIALFPHRRVDYRIFSDEEKRQIVFKEVTTGEVSHVTELESRIVPDSTNVIGFFTRAIMGELRLFSGHDVLYGKVKEFVQSYLFNQHVQLDDLNTLRNLSEVEAKRTLIETFKKQINALTIVDRGEAEVREYIKISQARPFIAHDERIYPAKKSVFNRVVGDSYFELEFASFLDGCDDIISFAKNGREAVKFRIEYVNALGNLDGYYPDFIIKISDKKQWIVETKGREDLDDPLKIDRLDMWCRDTNSLQKDVEYSWLLVKQDDFEKYKPRDFAGLIRTFQKDM
jgi:type III restriction enzyme